MSFLVTQDNLSSLTLFTRFICIRHTKHQFYGSPYTTFHLVILLLILMLFIGILFQTNTKITSEVLESLEASLQQYGDSFSAFYIMPL
jgi:hypothetical protein